MFERIPWHCRERDHDAASLQNPACYNAGSRGAFALMKPAFRSVLLLAVAAFLPIFAFAAITAFVSWRQERAAVERDDYRSCSTDELWRGLSETLR